MLPNYLIAGTVRSGTTSLHRMLKQHPEVFVSSSKELHFFDHNFHRGLSWYEDWFVGGRGAEAVGEATPNYLFHPDAAPRMAEVIPAARIIVLLRDPIARAYSHYWMHRASGGETLSFDEALAEESRRVEQGDPIERGPFGYVLRGRYLDQLQRLRRYYPEQQTLVLLYEDLRDHPAGTYERARAFLGLDPSPTPQRLGEHANQHRSFHSSRVRAVTGRLRAHGRTGRLAAHLLASVNSRPTAYPPMSPEARAVLEAAYAEPNAALATWLGRDLHEWASCRQADSQ